MKERRMQGNIKWIQFSPVDVFSPLVLGKRLAQQKAACLPGRPISFPYESCCYVCETIRLAVWCSSQEAPASHHNTCATTALYPLFKVTPFRSLCILFGIFFCHCAVLLFPPQPVSLSSQQIPDWLTDWLAYSWLDLLPTPSLLDYLWFCGLGAFEPCLFIWSC